MQLSQRLSFALELALLSCALERDVVLAVCNFERVRAVTCCVGVGCFFVSTASWRLFVPEEQECLRITLAVCVHR